MYFPQNIPGTSAITLNVFIALENGGNIFFNGASDYISAEACPYPGLEFVLLKKGVWCRLMDDWKVPGTYRTMGKAPRLRDED